MFKRIFNLMRQDWTNTLRDNILLYMIVGPILLTVGARLFLPSLDQAQFTFAVEAGLQPALIERLDGVGRVEILPDAGSVRERVLRNDDVPGLVIENGSPVLVFEGNEGESAEVLGGVIAQVLSGESVANYTLVQPGGQRSLMTEYTVIIFIMIGTLLGALVMAFNIIEDKETRAVRALGVSPLSMLELTLARGLFAVILSLFITLASAFILIGSRALDPLLLAAFLFSLGLPILTGYIIGGLADSQLKAIALLKFYMLVYLTVPILTIFLPRDWQVFFYLLPNYWMWHTFENVLIGNLSGPGFWLSGVITLATSLVLVVILMPMLRRQLRVR